MESPGVVRVCDIYMIEVDGMISDLISNERTQQQSENKHAGSNSEDKSSCTVYPYLELHSRAFSKLINKNQQQLTIDIKTSNF